MSIIVEKFKAGFHEKGSGYSFFVPGYINDIWLWTTPEINLLLEKAAVSLGQLNTFSKLVPDIDLFIQLHIAKEAVLSSRIEGTQTNMEEALLPEKEISPDHRQDWQEVRNYIRALNHAIHKLDKLPVSSRLIKETHEILLQSVRGETKSPGEFRTSQNWIGGRSLSDAQYIPPHHSYIHDLMGDLEKFIHNNQISVPALIRIGIAHYQFETIHPFLDGNGRIGRLLITLSLVNYGLLDKPILYVSTFFEKNKTLYYDNLTRVRAKNDMLQWLKYFLVGLDQSATEAINTLNAILKLKTKTEEKIYAHLGRRSAKAIVLLQHLFANPYMNANDVMQVTRLSKKAANDLIEGMEQQKILKEITNLSRNRMYKFHEYLALFK